jgi:hypothetical protein
VSVFTAITLSRPPNFAAAVMSYRKLVYPYGWVPMSVPFTYTLALAITPSNSTYTLRVLDTASAKCLRYQPMPEGR